MYCILNFLYNSGILFHSLTAVLISHYDDSSLKQPKSVTCDLSVSLSNCPELKLGHEDYDKDTHKKAHYQRPSRKPLGAQDNGKMTWLSGHAMLHENFRKSK